MQGLLSHILEHRYRSMCIKLANSVECIPNIQEKYYMTIKVNDSFHFFSIYISAATDIRYSHPDILTYIF